jgi:hypothetical protein
MDFAAYCSSCGFDPATLSASQKTALQAAWRANHAQADISRSDILDRYLAGAGDATAANAIRSAYEQATAAGLDAKQTELRVMQASRQPGPSQYGRGSGGGDRASILEAGLLTHLGVSAKHVAGFYGDQVADMSSSREHRVTGIQQVFREVLAANGKHAPSGKLGDADIVETFRVSQMGPSTISLTGILSNVANKSLLAGFNDVPMTWQRWAKAGANVDFKTATRYRMTGSGEFKQIAPGGQIQHVSLSEASATARLDTFGAILGIDRTQIINDDLSAFAGVPRALSRMAAIKVEKVATAKLLENAGGTTTGFFSTANLNFTSGAGSALQASALATAYAKFTEQMDSNSDPIMIPPTLLVVPPALEITARVLVSSMEVTGSTTANALMPNGNPWAGKFEVVVVPFLADVFGLTNSSDTGWYLLTDPGDYSCVEVNFLNGRQAPVVETAEMDFDRLGVAMRAFHDFSANTLEHRGGVLNAGA